VGPRDLLLIAAEILERLEIKYFVTGSFGSSIYGEYRFTNDVDIVIELKFGKVRDLIEAFPSDEYYLSHDAIRQALEHATQFNVVHSTSGLKIDFMVPDVEGYNGVRFERARRIEVAPGRTVLFAAPEDVILKKLEYFKMGQSDKHLRDIASMIKVSGETFDRDYLERWSKALDVTEEWQAVKSRVGW
jgi:predicted nucleotidyltransferase